MPKSAINIGSLIPSGRVAIIRGQTDKNAVIQSLVGLIARDFPDISHIELVEKITQREQGISTTLDTGLSIPHARLENISEFACALAIIPEGIKDPSQPGIAVRAVFLFASPASPKFFKKHLQLLSALSSTFQPVFIDRLIQLNEPPQIAQEILNDHSK
ncbi:MAG: PTS sugar transporter subunit IIA [Elusimicrobia bacterium]|nr:PTS sugar transporter subunit IIA [Elusimicrobiota bacterium]